MRRVVALLAFVAVPLAVVGASVSSACSLVDGSCGQCYVAYECVERCDSPVVQSGCCPCPSGTRDKRELRCVDPPPDAAPVPPDCTKAACIRAVICVASCGGPVVQSGCCPCPQGTFDDIVCGDAGGDAGRPDASDVSDASDASDGT